VEQLADQFGAWERRGRGWQVSDYPVPLEPPFSPFLFHAPLHWKPAIDDGRRVRDTRDREEKLNIVADLFDLGQLMLETKAIGFCRG